VGVGHVAYSRVAVTQARVLLFGLAAIYLVGVIVQFFLAGLGAFAASSYDAHQGLGLALAALALLLLVAAFVGKVPRSLLALTFTLLGLNVLQIVFARLDVAEIAALHVLNALAVALVAIELVQRSRRYLASKLDG
jgi:hypothetical protein